MSNRTEVVPGMVFKGRYPFIRVKVSLCDEDGPYEAMSWKPGVNHEPYYVPPGECNYETVADGEGEILLTVVSIHKPGRYPTRVFYTRKWRAPDGHEFGKNGCRVATAEKFLRLAGGYRFEYAVKPPAPWKMAETKRIPKE